MQAILKQDKFKENKEKRREGAQMSELKTSISVVFEKSFRESFNIPEQKRKKEKYLPL